MCRTILRYIMEPKSHTEIRLREKVMYVNEDIANLKTNNTEIWNWSKRNTNNKLKSVKAIRLPYMMWLFCCGSKKDFPLLFVLQTDHTHMQRYQLFNMSNKIEVSSTTAPQAFIIPVKVDNRKIEASWFRFRNKSNPSRNKYDLIWYLSVSPWVGFRRYPL